MFRFEMLLLITILGLGLSGCNSANEPGEDAAGQPTESVDVRDTKEAAVAEPESDLRFPAEVESAMLGEAAESPAVPKETVTPLQLGPATGIQVEGGPGE